MAATAAAGCDVGGGVFGFIGAVRPSVDALIGANKQHNKYNQRWQWHKKKTKKKKNKKKKKNNKKKKKEKKNKKKKTKKKKKKEKKKKKKNNNSNDSFEYKQQTHDTLIKRQMTNNKQRWPARMTHNSTKYKQ